MVTMVLPVPIERELDWSAAAAAVRDVRLAILWDTGELYPWEEWLWDTDNLPGAVPAFTALRAAQVELHDHACLLRGAIEHGWPEELIEITTPTHRVWITGGPSWGDAPGDLIGPTIYLAEAGVTDAAGFDGYTRYDGPPISSRRLDFSADDLRLTRFGVVAGHAAEQALGMDHPGARATANEWFDAWLQELEPQQDADQGPALLRFAARGLALSCRLKFPEAELDRERLDERARELCRVADEGGLEGRPRRRAWRTAVREVRQLADELRDLFEVFDDAAAHDDPEVRRFVEIAGGTFADALEVEVAAHPLFASVAALVDLYRDDTAELMDVAPVPIRADSPRASKRRPAPLDQYLSLVLVGAIDWEAAERAVEALDPDARQQRRADLNELKRLITHEEYRRFATGGQHVGDHELFIAAPHGGGGSDVSVAIGRLGRDGVLEAAGVVCWRAPDPEQLEVFGSES